MEWWFEYGRLIWDKYTSVLIFFTLYPACIRIVWGSLVLRLSTLHVWSWNSTLHLSPQNRYMKAVLIIYLFPRMEIIPTIIAFKIKCRYYNTTTASDSIYENQPTHHTNIFLDFPYSFVQEFACEPLDGVTLLLELLRNVQLSQTGEASRGPPAVRRRPLLDELACL